MGRGCGRKGSLLLLHAQAMKGIGNRRLLSRRDFLAGLAGAALLGVAGCASEESEGLARIVFSHGEDSEILRDQIRRFNEHNRGTIEVALRLAPADSSQYFEKLRVEFQAGQADAVSAPEQQKERALRGGYLPTREECYEDREILSEVPVITLGRDAIHNVRSRPVFGPSTATCPSRWPSGSTPRSPGPSLQSAPRPCSRKTSKGY